MTTFLLTTGSIILALAFVPCVSSKRTSHTSDDASVQSLLPGDIKYESPSGNFRFYFLIPTSIVICIILSLVRYFLS
jgi:hypothetical protein